MTQGEQAFFKRRVREEPEKANQAEEPYLRNLHLGWASLYEQRLDGVPSERLSLPAE